jgi:alkaline phosphatase
VNRGSLESPSLDNASVAALEVLSRDPEGFFLLIEQGDIDWSNHHNDFGRMVGCVSDLDAAVRAVVAFVDRPADGIDWTNTTLFVTADHANSYMRFVRPLFEGDLPTQIDSTYPDGEVTYGTGTHTSELVNVYAKGFAAPKLYDYATPYPGLNIIDDTSIYRLILDAARR